MMKFPCHNCEDKTDQMALTSTGEEGVQIPTLKINPLLPCWIFTFYTHVVSRTKLTI